MSRQRPAMPIEEAARADERIADEIRKVSRSVKQLLEGPLLIGAIVTLLSAQTHISRKNVNSILQAAANMERDYLKPKKLEKS